MASWLETSFREDLLGVVVAITGTAERDGAKTPFMAVLYFAWANRGPSEMAAWISTESPDANDSCLRKPGSEPDRNLLVRGSK